MRARFILTSVAFAIVSLLPGCNSEKGNDCDETPAPAKNAASPRTFEKIDDARLTNAFKFTSKVWGGAEPHDEDAFLALKSMGVKTILSVDGAKPNVDLARKYGLRYVHLPFAYEELPTERADEIAKALVDLPGPIYLHCHHGKHRSGSAIGTACVLNGMLTPEEGVHVLETAGTGPEYLGLWAAARNARPLDKKTLKNIKVEYHEQTPIPPLADEMVRIDTTFTDLGECRKAGWATPKANPDLDPPHEALIVREHFAEIQRTDNFKARPQQFKDWMAAAESAAKELEESLRATTRDETRINDKFAHLEKSCKECHAVYRNVPQH